MSKKIGGSRIRQSKLVLNAVKTIKGYLIDAAESVTGQIISFLDDYKPKVEVTNKDTNLIKEVAENTRKSNSRLGELVKKEFTSKVEVKDLKNEVKVTNLKDYPKTIKVSNLKEFPKTIKVSNLDKIKYPQTIRISNLGEIKLPKPVNIDISPLENSLRGLKSAFSDIKRELPRLKQKDLPQQKDLKEVSRHIDAMAERLDDALTNLHELIKEKDFGGAGQTVIKSQSGGSKYADVTVNGLRGIPQSTAVTVITSATKLPSTALENRRSLIVYNNSSNTVYIGGSDVTTGNGMPIASESYSPPIDASDQMTIYAIAGSNSEVRVLEVSTDKSGS